LKATIFDGSIADGDATIDGICQKVVDHLSQTGWETEIVDLRNKQIASCKGCFGCWVKTPGICVIDDYGREIAKKVVQSDLLVYVTPVTFGGYSSELKKALDRIIPSILPYFKIVRGEVHHAKRYKRSQRLAVFGVQAGSDPERERIFKALVDRNSINLHSPAHGASVLVEGEGGQEIDEQVGSLLTSIGVMT
jgi:multimeric flavodoxin WrbA